jgi:TfoX/Sxy family transcriptional regulator of competence genes
MSGETDLWCRGRSRGTFVYSVFQPHGILVSFAKADRRRKLVAFSESLAGRVRDALARNKSIEEKRMFGGVGFLLTGNMLVGVWKNSLIVRVGPEAYDDAIVEPHVREFDITGKSMKGWIMVEPEGIEDDEQLFVWIERATKFVSSLPKKAARKRP